MSQVTEPPIIGWLAPAAASRWRSNERCCLGKVVGIPVTICLCVYFWMSDGPIAQNWKLCHRSEIVSWEEKAPRSITGREKNMSMHSAAKVHPLKFGGIGPDFWPGEDYVSFLGTEWRKEKLRMETVHLPEILSISVQGDGEQESRQETRWDIVYSTAVQVSGQKPT